MTDGGYSAAIVAGAGAREGLLLDPPAPAPEAPRRALRAAPRARPPASTPRAPRSAYSPAEPATGPPRRKAA